MINKILGYILLVVGIVIITGSMWQSYNIFTNKISAPLIFSTPPASNTTTNTGTQNQQDQLQQLLSLATQKQVGQMISPDTITKILNLLSWSLLATVLVFGGGAIAGIGVKLIK